MVYDRAGMHTAPERGGCSRPAGHARVAVLDGGLPKWRADGGPVESGQAVLPVRRYVADAPMDTRLHADRGPGGQPGGRANRRRARPPGAIAATKPSHGPVCAAAISRAAPQSSLTRLLDAADGTLLDAARLEAVFSQAGIDPRRPIICTCGSSVTACVIRLALARPGGGVGKGI